MEKEINLEKLKEPITPRWRVQSTKNNKAICTAYIDARQAQDRLDDVCGAQNWQNTYDPETGSSSIAILINGDWIWKSDVGTEREASGKLGATERESIKHKGKASDAFKRAAILWGVGRFLYKIENKVLSMDGNYAKTPKGTILYTGDQLSNYINGLSEGKALLMQLWNLNKDLQSDEVFKTSISNLKNLV